MKVPIGISIKPVTASAFLLISGFKEDSFFCIISLIDNKNRGIETASPITSIVSNEVGILSGETGKTVVKSSA